jgi:hypothetical protein
VRLRLAVCLLLLVGLFGPPSSAIGASGRADGRDLRALHPDWLLPAWTADGPAVWTEVGPPYAASVSLIAPDGSFAPRNHGPAVNVWLYDLDSAHLLVPSEHGPRLRLDDDFLPIVTSSWDAADLHVETTYFTGWPGGDPSRWFAERGSGSEQAVTFVRVSITTSSAAPRHVSAFVAVRPFGVERDLHPITTASCQAADAVLIADGTLVLAGNQPANACGATSLSMGELSTFAVQGALPKGTAVTDATGGAEAMLRVDVIAVPGAPASLEFRAPLARVTSNVVLPAASFDGERTRVASAWRAALGSTSFDVTDAGLSHAFLASQAYLLLNRTGAAPRSGPLAHDAFWVRDAAYIGQAMERAGFSIDNQATLEALVATQRDDGSFPAITDANGPRPAVEWDAPCEAIAGLVAHYRFTHDRAWLERVYPNIAHAARFLDALRGRTLSEDPETRSLLPPNVSAEDLGSAEWHHYWDDLWAIAGYREAAFAAAEIGMARDAADFGARVVDLQSTLLSSVALVQAQAAIAFMPNGPEDVQSSAMARGTMPALWPVRALQGGIATDLLTRSFHAYYQTWLAPQGGGYRHVEGTLWPYGGLGIAHAMLRLGMLPELWQVLEWTMQHQTIPGTYAWGEGINATNGGLELGDMPHSWAAAELISLLRDMVVSEQDGVIQVNGGTPDSWLDAGQHVTLTNAPSEYGPLNVSSVRGALSAAAGGAPDLSVQLDGNPPRGWLVRVPGTPSQVAIDGAPLGSVSASVIPVPPGAHRLVVRY